MKFILKKIGTLIITLVIISFLSFLAFSLIPGDAAVSNLGMDADEAAVEALREELGLNRPIYVQYGDWLWSAMRGDFGESTQYHLPVSELVAKRLPATVTLALYSMIIVVVVSFPFGMLGTNKPGGILDTTMTVLSQIGMAIPQFFLGILLTFFFGIMLQLTVDATYRMMTNCDLPLYQKRGWSMIGFLVCGILDVAYFFVSQNLAPLSFVGYGTMPWIFLISGVYCLYLSGLHCIQYFRDRRE